MRIYDGSPRQDWEEVLRSIGAFADSEHLKEILLLELEGGFLLQGIGLQGGGADSDSYGSAVKRTYELTDDQVAELMDTRSAQRGNAEADGIRGGAVTPHLLGHLAVASAGRTLAVNVALIVANARTAGEIASVLT